MSEALTPEAPELDSEVPAVADQAPEDSTAVESGSAGATADTVEASRFNGLMSAHQKALAELATERTQRAALEARLTQQEETPQVTDSNDALAAQVESLRNELQTERLAGVKARVLEQYPEAKPLADLIVGSTPEEIESVAAAIAERLQAIVAPPAEVVTTDEGVTPPEPVITAPVVHAPVVVGGTAPPAIPGQEERVAAALQEKSWDKFWAAKSNTDVSQLA